MVAKYSVENAFTALNHYQPKILNSLMEKAINENKKEN